MRSFVIAALMTALVAGLGAALVPERPAFAARAVGDAATEDDRALAGSQPPASADLDGTAAPDTARPEPARGAISTFYQWTDERGSVRFARSLDEVPPAWRERAGKLEVDTAAYTKAPAGAAPAPRGAAFAGVHDVTVYTAPWCGWCRKTLAFLDQRRVEYLNKDIEKNEIWADELYEKSGGRSIPFVEIDGTQIRGYSPHEMAALLE